MNDDLQITGYYCTIYANLVIIIISLLSLAKFDYDYVTNSFSQHVHFKGPIFLFFFCLFTDRLLRSPFTVLMASV